MTRFSTISARRIIVVVGFVLGLIQTTVFAQGSEEVHIESADSLWVDEINGERVTRLDGSVVLRQDETILHAERAIQYQQSDLIVFDGGVEIVDEGDTLAADRIEYRTETKVASGFGNVVWTDGEVELTAALGTYNVDEKVAFFSGDVLMRDSTTTITSDAAEYHVEEETAIFTDDVALKRESLQLLADRVTHDRRTGGTVAGGSVTIHQTAGDSTDTSIILIGGQAESESETGTSRLWDDPFMFRISRRETGEDTLVVKADELEVTASDTAESFRANGNAVMWKDGLSGLADSLRYADTTDDEGTMIAMTGSPVLWSGDAQVSGDTIQVHLSEGSPAELTAGPGAFVAFEDTALGRFQQIRGDALVATFRDDSLRQLVVAPQAEALYFGEESEDGRDSAIQFSSSSITMYFDGGEIGKIVASTDVEGGIEKFDPKTPPSLEGFEWRAERKPRRDSLITEELLEALHRAGTATE
jgi:lipopolysaccharide export system protein LptA